MQLKLNRFLVLPLESGGHQDVGGPKENRGAQRKKTKVPESEAKAEGVTQPPEGR